MWVFAGVNNYIEHIVWLLSVTICLLLELSCFWPFVKLLVYYIKVESLCVCVCVCVCACVRVL